MNVVIFLAQFWGSLFMLLGLQSVFANLLGRTIQMTEERAVVVSTGYITLLLGLVTVILYTQWVPNWTVAITILGWVTLLKGAIKIGFPDHVHKQAQLFKRFDKLWGFIIFLIGVYFFWMSVVS